MATVTVIFAGQEQQTRAIDQPKMVVGREPVCEIPIDNLGISRQHCALISRGDTFLVQDLGSANGTYVNGKKIVEHYLNDGDEIFIGKYILKFRNESQEKAAPAKEGPVVPDTLNTFVMDGSKIQEQLAKMRAQASGGAPASAPGAALKGATAKDYAKAMDLPKSAGDQGATLKLVIIVGGILIALLLIAVVVLLLKMT